MQGKAVQGEQSPASRLLRCTSLRVQQTTAACDVASSRGQLVMATYQIKLLPHYTHILQIYGGRDVYLSLDITPPYIYIHYFYYFAVWRYFPGWKRSVHPDNYACSSLIRIISPPSQLDNATSIHLSIMETSTQISKHIYQAHYLHTVCRVTNMMRHTRSWDVPNNITVALRHLRMVSDRHLTNLFIPFIVQLVDVDTGSFRFFGHCTGHFSHGWLKSIIGKNNEWVPKH